MSAAQRANAQKLVNARLAYVPRTVMASPPTLTNSGGSSTIGSSNDGASANSLLIRDTTKFRATGPLVRLNPDAEFLGVQGTWSQYGPSTFSVGGAGWGYGFVFNGSQFELVTGVLDRWRLRMRVNGQWASASQWSKANFGSPADTDFCVLKFNFGSAAVRTIEIFTTFNQKHGCWINIPAGTTVTPMPIGANETFIRGWRDSYGEVAYADGAGMDMKESMGHVIGEMLGAALFTPAGRSNQGYTNVVDGQTFGSRMIANANLLTPRTAEEIGDSLNDNAASANALYDAKLAALRGLRAQANVADAIILNHGPIKVASVHTTQAYFDQNYAACKAAAMDYAKEDAAFVFAETNDLPAVEGGAVLPNGQTQVNFDAAHPGRNYTNYAAPIIVDRYVAELQAKLAA